MSPGALLPLLLVMALENPPPPAKAAPPLPAQAGSIPELVPDPGHPVRDALGGGGAAFRFESAILGQTRRIAIVLPPSFPRSSSGRRYPVTIVLDGEFCLAPIAAVSDHLARHGLIPESILVAIENVDPYEGRVHDLTPPGLSVSGSSLNEGGERFLDFIERELLPAVDSGFRGGGPRTIIGHSSGAILATYAAATRPAFRAVVAVDAPIHLGNNWLAKKLLTRATADRTPLRYAYYGVRFSWPAAEWDALGAAAPVSWRLHAEKLQQEGHETALMIGAYLGLRQVFSDYSRLSAPVSPTTRILPYYDSLAGSFGLAMVPPRRSLHDVAEDLAMEGRGAQAHEVYDRLVAAYGVPEDAGALLERIAEAERRPPPEETVEGLLATPFPSPEEAKDYLGEWTGDTWMKPGLPRDGRTLLRLRVVEGRVAGEIERLDAPEDNRIQKLEYLKVTPAGLSFGYMNGMRPRGLILHEGTLSGETLAGRTRWGGINFKYPAGITPPEPGFSFTRMRRPPP